MEFDEDIKFEYFTKSSVVSKTPCFVVSIFACSGETTSKYLKLYNGVNNSATLLMTLYASKFDNIIVILEEPLYFDKGLYIEFETNIEAATIQFKPEY